MLTYRDLQRIAKVTIADTESGFVELTRIAGLNPAKHYRGALLMGDMHGENLAGFDFTGATFDGCDMRGTDLRKTRGITPAMLATAIIDETTLIPDFASQRGPKAH
jgi:hypothetical protein